MDNEIRIWLSDIKQAITEINQFLPEKKIFQEFQKDLKLKRAIERNVEIIENPNAWANYLLKQRVCGLQGDLDAAMGN